MYIIKYTKQADSFLAKHKKLKEQIKKIFIDIIENPYIKIKNYDIAKLKGLEDTYRLRKGDYRVIFEIKDRELLIYVIKADNRGNVYK